MKVLVLATEVAGRGGVQYAGRLFAQALASRGAALTVVSVLDRDADAERLGLPGLRLLGAGGDRRKAAFLAAKTALSERFDRVLVMHLNLAPVTLVPGFFRGAPLRAAWPRPASGGARALGVIHSLEAWTPLSPVRRAGVTRVGSAGRWVSVSDHSRRTAIAHNPWLAKLDYGVLHLGLLPTEDKAEVGRSEAFAGHASVGDPAQVASPLPDHPFLLVIGRMSRSEGYKGHEELVRAWPEVRRSRPDLSLAIIGQGDDRDRLVGLARDLGILAYSPRDIGVHFLGGVDEHTKQWALSTAAAFALPARGEGFGLVYLEAMRAGRAVLAGVDDSAKEIVLDRQTGRTIDPRRPDEVVRGVLEVTDPAHATWGEAGRRRFEAAFSFEAFAHRLEAAFSR